MEGHEKNYPKRQYMRKSLYELTFSLELVIAAIVLLLIIVQIIGLISIILSGIEDGQTFANYSNLLRIAFDIVIGIEFLKMLYMHNMDSVVEVLLFTLARHLIIQFDTTLDALVCIIAVAILFVVRKYLFVAQIDKGAAADPGMRADVTSPSAAAKEGNQK